MQRRQIYRSGYFFHHSVIPSRKSHLVVFFTVHFTPHYPAVILVKFKIIGVVEMCAAPRLQARPASHPQSGLRAPCQVIRGPAAACPVEALRSEITPPETLAAGGLRGGGGWRWMLTYIHRQHAATGAAVFEQSAMKIPEKILAAT